jgi:UDP-2,3-diacylglucosamine pyrophosphatase LpxH
MLVVISDLHFTEEESSHPEPLKGLYTPRNLPADTFQLLMAEVDQTVRRKNASGRRIERVDLVLAGDVFDLHRTELWFEPPGPDLRPYVRTGDVKPGSPLETKLLHILDQITKAKHVGDSLAAFRSFAAGAYEDRSRGVVSSSDVTYALHYFPGNHDRLVQATPALRAKIRNLLGLSGGDTPFPRQLPFRDPDVLVRHGHEYDRYNFGADHRRTAPIPEVLPDWQYDAPTLGDFITLGIASRVPFLFRAIHGEQNIASDPLLRTIYSRILEIDDLRPQSALPRFLLNVPGATPKEAWRVLLPVAQRLLDEIRENPFFADHLVAVDARWRWLIRALLKSRAWTVANAETSPVWALLTGKLAGIAGGDDRPAAFAEREEAIRSGLVRCVVAGHTHAPDVAPVGAGTGGERYFVDAGTWRNRIPATPSETAYGRIKALTYVFVYGRYEFEGAGDRDDDPRWSFNFWNGFTQQWPRA